jgi:DNA-binding MltR family transcriptional regulator
MEKDKEVRIKITIDSHEQLAKMMVRFTKIGAEDRALVIGIMSMIHLQLKKVLQPVFLKENKPLEKDNLLAPGKPLGNFDSTCLAAYRLQKIPKIIFDDLNVLNRIRNKFAHNAKVSFESKIINDCFKELKILKAHEEPSKRLKKCNKELLKKLDLSGLKLDFIWAASWISLIIEELCKIELFSRADVMHLVLDELQDEYCETIESWIDDIRKSMQEYAATLAKSLQGKCSHDPT